MCGIAGIWQHSSSCFEQTIDKSLIFSALKHRGPDDQGLWMSEDSRTSLLQTRLSIVDLSNHGHQPMVSHSGRYVISFNGEIYNHESIRGELTAQGASFSGTSDTEVLIEAFDRWGVAETLQKINGMFSIALYDRDSKSLTLVRDRLGEKPLYYGVNNGTVFFASELKAFKGWGDFSGEIDRHAISQYLFYGFIPAPLSIFTQIKKLTPGHVITFNGEDLPESKPYWDLSKVINQRTLTNLNRDEVLNDLESLLLDSVNLRIKSDVKMGTFLSGGVDSSLITALIQSLSGVGFDSYTIAFDDERFDEGPAAKKVADFIGTNHHEILISESDLIDIVPKLSEIYCEPFADESQIPTVLVSKLAAQEVKVILSGDGGDELFGGYNRHIASNTMEKSLGGISIFALKLFGPMFTPKLRLVLQNVLQSRGYNINIAQLHKLVDGFGAKSDVEVYQTLLRYSDTPAKDSEGGQNVQALGVEHTGLNLTEAIMAYDQLCYLPDDILVKVDRASMASSLETRVPFLDHRLVEFSWGIGSNDKIQGRTGKVLLRDLLYRYVPSNLFSIEKKGFGVPIANWLRGGLKDWGNSLINETPQNDYVDMEYVKYLWEEHIKGGRDRSKDLWKHLILLSWLRTWQAV